MLTSTIIDSGAYLERFESQPHAWPLERIEASLAGTMRQRPAGAADVWLFGYGSLMWNPMVDFDVRRPALLHGWHRAFCLHMVIGRASHERPGRMLAVEPHGVTAGMAFRLPRDTLDQELRRVWIREMVLGSYQPTWAPVAFDDGTRAHAIVFAANPDSPQYQADSSVKTVAPLIGSARGEFGSNADYVFRMRAALNSIDLRDSYVDALVERLARLAGHDACRAELRRLRAARLSPHGIRRNH